MVQVRKLGLVIRDLKIFANPAVEFLTALIVNTAYGFNFRRLTHFLSDSESVGGWLELVGSSAWTRQNIL